jgi:outer membrane protein TolC
MYGAYRRWIYIAWAVAVAVATAHGAAGAAEDGEEPLLLTPQVAAMGAVIGGLKDTLPPDILRQLGPESMAALENVPAGGEFLLPLPESIGGGEVKLSAEEARSLMQIRGAIAVEAGVRSLRAAQRGIAVAETMSAPTLDLQASRVRRGPEVSFDVPMGDEVGSVTVVPDSLSMATLGFRKPIWDSGKTRLEKYIARRNYEVAKKELVTAAGWSALEAYQLCIEMMRSQRQSQVAAVSLMQRKEILSVAIAQYANGQVARYQVIEAERDIAEARQFVALAEAAVKKNEIGLKTLLRLDPEREIRVEPGPMLSVPDLDLEYMMRRAVGDVEGYSGRSDLIRTQEEAKRAAAETLRPRVEKGPTVDVIASTERQTSTGLSSDTSWQVGIGATWTIWDGGTSKKLQGQMRELFEASKLRAEEAAEQIMRQVASAYVDVEAGGEIVNAAQVETRRAAENFRLQMLRFEEGFTIATEVLDAESQLTEARAGLIDAEQDHNTAVAKLRSAMGDWRALIGFEESPQ